MRNESGRNAAESKLIRVVVGDGDVGAFRSAPDSAPEGSMDVGVGASRHAENGIGNGCVFHGSLPDDIEADPRDWIRDVCGEPISAVLVCRGIAVCTEPADTYGTRAWEEEKSVKT